MCWVTDNDNVILHCVADKLWAVVAVVTIKEDEAELVIRNLSSCLCIEINKKLVAKLGVRPAFVRYSNSGGVES